MRVRGTLLEGRKLLLLAISAFLIVPLLQVIPLAQNSNEPSTTNDALAKNLGMTVNDIQIRGVSENDQSKLLKMLPQKKGEALDRSKLRGSIQALYATGRFADITPEAESLGDRRLNLTFDTSPNYFVGLINVEGAPGRPTENQIMNASKLQLGELFTREKLDRGIKRVREVLEENGYYRSKIAGEEQPNPITQQMDILLKISPGERAHVGAINLTGKPGYSMEEIRDLSGLHPGDDVSSDRLTRGLQKLRKKYQKKERLLAQVLVDRKYRPERNAVDYTFDIKPGPVVQIAVEGYRMRQGLIKRYVPVFEENALDDDLVNEGRRNLLDYLQTRGYFEAKVGVKKESPNPDLLRVVYVIIPGATHKLSKVFFSGNKYFGEEILRARMQTQPAARFVSHGRYSQTLLASDVRGLEELYRANGFSQVKITTEVIDNYSGVEDLLAVDVKVNEGPQTLVGALHIIGNDTVPADELKPLLSTAEGQPFSDFNVSSDRDAVLNAYFNRGFPNATFEASAKPAEGQPNHIDVSFSIHEGEQIFVDQVYVNGLNFTRPYIVQQQLQVHSGEPVSQVEMLDTQRRLYDLGVFNQVDTAIQNPEGQEPYKNILVDVRETKRYTFNYGLGIEVQTGQPAGAAAPTGRTGVSPRISFDVTRLNFRGVDHTLSFKSHVGRLQQRVLLSYDAPRWFNRDNLRLTFTAFYDNTLDVSTFTSKRLEGSVEAEQDVNKFSKVYYRFAYRQVQATNFASNFNHAEAPLLSQPTRVGMPGLSYIRDQRDNPLESTKGNYSTFDAGVASTYFGSQADFSRVLVQNSTYYRIKKRYIFARSTRVGVENPFRKTVILAPTDAIQVPAVCRTNPEDPTCPQEIPLPERFFSGGGNSLRGFGLNQAGPRDLFSGFPIGGSGLFINNLELRFPPPTLPFFENNISFAIFHDAGNIFDTGHDMLHSLLRWHQKDPDRCVTDTADHQCDFNYVSHAVGVGVRYKTPIGPVRFDFGYNLNPPAFPSCQASPVFTGQVASAFCAARSDPTNPSPFFKPNHSGRFNVYFSIGQTF